MNLGDRLSETRQRKRLHVASHGYNLNKSKVNEARAATGHGTGDGEAAGRGLMGSLVGVWRT